MLARTEHLRFPRRGLRFCRSFRVENPVQDNWCRLHCRLHIDGRRYLDGCGRGPGTWNVHVDFGIPDFGITDLGILAVGRRDEPQKRRRGLTSGGD